jgi:hypothetical protein
MEIKAYAMNNQEFQKLTETIRLLESQGNSGIVSRFIKFADADTNFSSFVRATFIRDKIENGEIFNNVLVTDINIHLLSKERLSQFRIPPNPLRIMIVVKYTGMTREQFQELSQSEEFKKKLLDVTAKNLQASGFSADMFIKDEILALDDDKLTSASIGKHSALYHWHNSNEELRKTLERAVNLAWKLRHRK